MNLILHPDIVLKILKNIKQPLQPAEIGAWVKALAKTSFWPYDLLFNHPSNAEM